MLYLVLSSDGRVKAYTDRALADRCVIGDGGQVVPVEIARPVAAYEPEVPPTTEIPPAAAAPDPAPEHPSICSQCGQAWPTV